MKIFTLNARSNIILDVVKQEFNLSFEEMGNEINAQYNILYEELKLKNIKYENLKNILIPRKDKKEICLVFDTTFINECWYGYTIFKKYFPLMVKFSGVCIFEGDLIGSNENQNILNMEMKKHIKKINPSIYRNSNQYYLIYINNLTDKKIEYIVDGLRSYQAFTGYFDFTYSNLLKDYISDIIGQRYFIYGKNIVMSSGDYDYTKENINTVGYDFEKYGFQIKSISDINYNMFLCYKIERKYYENDISDQLFSLSTISNKVEPLKKFKIIIEDNKLKYLFNEKTGSMKAGDFMNLEKSKIEKILKSKIENNYIYNLEIKEEHNTIMFNTIIEIENHFKFLVSLEYLYNDMELRLITMY